MTPTTGPARLRTADAVRRLLHLGLRVDELAADFGHDRGHRVLADAGRPLVRLVTEDEVVGWGEGVVPGGPWGVGGRVDRGACRPFARRHLALLVVGRDVLRPEALARRLEKLVSGAPSAKAGVEMAAWDAAGRALGLPVHQLLGGPASRHIIGHLGAGRWAGSWPRS